MTASEQLRQYLRIENNWVAKNGLCRLELKTKKGGLYGADLISRTLRSLEESSQIAVKYINGHSHYRYMPKSVRHLYVPTTQRKDDKMWTDENELKRLLAIEADYAAMHQKYATET